MERQQIDLDKAIKWGLENIGDHFDFRYFVEDVLENDMDSIGIEWPDFVASVVVE